MNPACPKCSSAVADDPTLWGKVVMCPSCGTSFQFPFPRPNLPDNPFASPQTRVSSVQRPRRRGKSLPHSGPGIAAFVIGFFGFVWMTISIISARNQAMRAVDRSDLESALVGVAAWFFLHALWATLGLALGIVGVFQPDRNRWFAIIGSVLNFIPLVFVLYVLVRS